MFLSGQGSIDPEILCVMKNLCLDVETSVAPFHRPWCRDSFLVNVATVDELGNKRVWWFYHREIDPVDQQKVVTNLQAYLDQFDRLIGHNFKFDLQWLWHLGIDTSRHRLFCTKIAEYLLHGQDQVQYNLDSLCERYNVPLKLDQVRKFWEAGYNTDEVPIGILKAYVTQDADSTLQVFQKQVPLIQRYGLAKLVGLQVHLMTILARMEATGVLVDQDAMHRYTEETRQKLAECEEGLFDLFGQRFNLGSGDELSAHLYGGVVKVPDKERFVTTKKCKYREPYIFTYKDGRKTVKYRTRQLDQLVVKERNVVHQVKVDGVGFDPPDRSELKKEGYFATDKGTIARLRPRNKKQRAILEMLGERSALAKLLETFEGKSEGTGLINQIHPDGCLHPSFNQTVTRTGRLSSSQPNGQNLPRGSTSPVKKVIIPRFDCIANADLSQLEWRVAGALSGDPVIRDEVIHDVDCHADDAIRLLGADPDGQHFKEHRTTAKITTFRLIYGGSAWGFYLDPEMPNYSLKKWQQIVEQFYEKYHRLGEWQQENIRFVHKRGYLRTPSGRILKFQKLDKEIATRRGEVYNTSQIKNYPVQAFATADITPLAMKHIWRKMQVASLRSMIILQVHDSIVFDAIEQELPKLREICVGTFRDLPRLIEREWGYKFTLPLDGDFEVGPTYGDVEPWPKAV